MKHPITVSVVIGLAGLAILLTACLGPFSSSEALANAGTTTSAGTVVGASTTTGATTAVVTSPTAVTSTTPSTSASLRAGTITLDRDGASMVGEGATMDDRGISITSAGTYTIQGELADGRIVVDVGDEDDVTLILDNADIRCSTFSPIYVANADEVRIVLKQGTTNYVEDGDTYILDTGEDEPNAAIFSHDDLTIAGDGSLTVVANFNNGIQSKDDLTLESGTITVVAANDGVKGRNSITILDANLTVDAGGDGLQSNNDEDPDKGIVTIEGGAIVIEAGADGIQAETTLAVHDGDLNLVTGGGSANSSTQSGWGSWGPQTAMSTSTASMSAKGLKAGSSLTIYGGTIEIDSSDDAIHSNDTLVIHGGKIILSSGDDGIHADSSLEINDGDVTINKSYEGLESMDISLNGGTIRVTASDDGVNAAGGNDGSALGGRPGMNMFNSSVSCSLTITGGTITIDAGGDGLDANGPMTMTDGLVIVNGPTNNGNGPLDYTGSFQISGGCLIAAGSSGMAQAPSSTSSQNSVMVNLTSAVSAGTLIHIERADGEDVVTFAPAKAWQSFLLSTSSLKSGETYSVYVGGSASGTSTDGLYSGGTYGSGTSVGSFSISTSVTTLGSTSGTWGQPGGRRP